MPLIHLTCLKPKFDLVAEPQRGPVPKREGLVVHVAGDHGEVMALCSIGWAS